MTRPLDTYTWIHSPTLADLDGDQKEEVLLGCNVDAEGTRIFGWRGDGTRLRGWPLRLGERNF